MCYQVIFLPVESQQTASTTKEMTDWITETSTKLAAMESLVKKKLRISDEEWQQAVDEARHS